MSGLFGVVSEANCSETLFYGTDYHSHLGTEFGGLAVLGDEFSRRIHDLSQSQFKSKFFDDCRQMIGKKGIGVIAASEEQPIYLNSRFGPFCPATAGMVENAEELAARLLRKGISFSEVGRKGVNTTELIGKLINQGADLVDGIERMFSIIEGSCSLLLLTRAGIHVARDRFGYTPLVVGRGKGSWAVTSESSAFPNLGFETVKYVEPGEILLISEDGIVQRKAGRKRPVQVCTFLWIYTGFPASSYDGINVEVVRERSGCLLAKRDGDIGVDMVCGVPDSGLAHGLGYAMESGKPFRRPLVKYTPGYGRSYTPPSQKTRDLIARMKLIPIKEVIEGHRIVLCEDSIVRGTQLKNYAIQKLWDCGAREVHVRAACPPLLFPCRFNLSTRSIDELAARKAIRRIEGHDIVDVCPYIDPTSAKYEQMVEVVRQDLGVTTLRYQTVDDMVEAIGKPKHQLCLYCWTGQCPESACRRSAIDIVATKKRPRKSSPVDDSVQQQLW